MIEGQCTSIYPNGISLSIS